MPVALRAAREEDLAIIREIERASGQRFREFGLIHVAEDEPVSIEALADYVGGGRAWVTTEEGAGPVGYLLVEEVDRDAHISQVSVLPDHQGRGLGRALIDRAAGWAAGQGLDALTLTTYDHIPWNRPLYEHLGFYDLAEDELGPGLRARRAVEAEMGLDPALRVVMRRDLDPATPIRARRNVHMRRAVPEDLEVAARIYLRSRRAAVPAIPPPVHDEGEVTRWFSRTLFSEQELWVAEDPAGRLVGLVALGPDSIEQLYVDPDAAGGGVGSRLLALAKSLRPAGLWLWTFQSNGRARRFYEERGFRAVEHTDGSRNEEGAADVRYQWAPGAARSG